MLRGVGGLMIFAGCLGLGLWYRGQFKGRVRALRLLGNLLELLAGEVRYGRSTLPECCRHVSAQLPQPFAEALLNVDRQMQENTGRSFACVLREELEGPLNELPLKAEDREMFLRFAPQSGFMDRQMQLFAMQQCRELMAGTVEKLDRENADKCRMALGLGVMGGLMLILVLW